MFRLFCIMLTLLILSLTAKAQLLSFEPQGPFAVLDIAKRPLEFPVIFNESDFESKPWMQEFEWVVVVNKAVEGFDRQSLRIYRNGRLLTTAELEAEVASKGKDARWQLQDLKKRQWSDGVYKISTGREEFEPKGKNGAQRDNYTITPSGYFVPQFFTRRHKSEAYSNSNCGGKPTYVREWRIEGRYPFQRRVQVIREIPPVKCVYMDDVVFFNGGIALHKAVPGTETALGKRASGGCVRMPGAVADFLYRNLSQAKTTAPVPLINQNGSVQRDGSGNILRAMKNKSIWGQLDARRVLIIVHEKITVPVPTPRPNIEAGL